VRVKAGGQLQEIRESVCANFSEKIERQRLRSAHLLSAELNAQTPLEAQDAQFVSGLPVSNVIGFFFD
jgi:hypothetical protein